MSGKSEAIAEIEVVMSMLFFTYNERNAEVSAFHMMLMYFRDCIMSVMINCMQQAHQCSGASRH